MTMPRSYHKAYSKNYYHKRKEELLNLLGGKCSKCNSDKNLQFDHIDPNSRSFKIGKLLNYSKEKVFIEIKKCQLLCHSCHNIKSYNEGSLHKNKAIGSRVFSSKLKEEDVKIILTLQGTNTAIAKRFNVSRGAIWHIKNKKTWKHIAI